MTWKEDVFALMNFDLIRSEPRPWPSANLLFQMLAAVWRYPTGFCKLSTRSRGNSLWLLLRNEGRVDAPSSQHKGSVCAPSLPSAPHRCHLRPWDQGGAQKLFRDLRHRYGHALIKWGIIKSEHLSGKETLLFPSSEFTDLSERKQHFPRSLPLALLKEEPWTHSSRQSICLKAALDYEVNTPGSGPGYHTPQTSSDWSSSCSEQILEKFLGWIWTPEGNRGSGTLHTLHMFRTLWEVSFNPHGWGRDAVSFCVPLFSSPWREMFYNLAEVFWGIKDHCLFPTN